MNTKTLLFLLILLCGSLSTKGDPCISPPSGLQGWWSGDSHADDITSNSNDGTPSNITYETSIVAEGFFLNGTNAYITVSESASLTVTNITVDAWIYPHDLEWQPIVEYGEANEFAGVHLWMGAGDGAPSAGSLLVNFRDSSGNNHSLLVDDIVPLNEWSFVAATYDRSSGVGKLYLNGDVIASQNFGTITLKTDKKITIGRRDPNSSDAGAGSHFLGTIDEVEIFNRALSETELDGIYEAGAGGKCKPCVTPPSGLAGWWSADLHANDLTVNSNDGTASNITYVNGNVEEGFFLNGTNSFVTISESASLTVTNITFDAWIYPLELEWQPIVEYGEANEAAGVHLWVGAGDGMPLEGSLLVNFRDSSGNNNSLVVDDVVPLDSWSFVAATYDKSSGVGKLYLNGNVIASQNFGSFTLKTDKKVTIGRREPTSLDGGAGSHFHGTIDELEIFNRALSEAELDELYAAGASGKCKD